MMTRYIKDWESVYTCNECGTTFIARKDREESVCEECKE